MFFINTIKKIAKRRKEQREKTESENKELKKYYDMSNAVYEALRRAEQIIGDKPLGITDESVKTDKDKFSFTVVYSVDRHLTVKIKRFFSNHLRKRLKTESDVFERITFFIDGIEIPYPNGYEDLAKQTADSLVEKVEQYRHSQDSALVNYLSSHKVEQYRHSQDSALVNYLSSHNTPVRKHRKTHKRKKGKSQNV